MSTTQPQWALVKLFAWLDELDRRAVPKTLRERRPANERFVRLVLQVLGAANLVFGVTRLVSGDWLSAGVSIVLGFIAVIGSRPFARWATEKDAEDPRP